MTRLRIFISSPGDVGEERSLAARVIAHLNDELNGAAILEPIFWEHEPLRATASFQEELPRPSQSDICILILWSRLGTRLPAHITRPDGTRYASGTEFEYEDALAGHRARGLPDLMVYRKTAKPVTELDSEEQVLDRLSQKKALEGFINKWFRDADGSFTAAFHSFETPAIFEQLLEEHLRKLVEKRLGDSAKPQSLARWKQGSPFRGLQVFDFEHSPIFFGRTGAISEVLNALRRQADDGRAFVLVLGMSGCGKSSLVRAGVLPNLTQPGVIEGIGLWRRAVLSPSDGGGSVFEALAAALLRPAALPEIVASGTDATELDDLLRASPKACVPLIKAALSQAASSVQKAENLAEPPTARLVLFVDQLEELFTLERITPEERKRFIDTLSALARSGWVWVLATLRSDFYAHVVDLPELVALKEGAGQYDLLVPTSAEIGQMIRQPARMAGLRFEQRAGSDDSLDDVLCDAAARDPEALPLLEFALEQLYRQCSEGGVLTYVAYERMGGVEQALATHAEEVFQSLSAEAQGAFEGVLGALVTPGLGSENRIARRRAPMEALIVGKGAPELVETFVTHRLFVTDRGEDGGAVVSVAHEALLRRWPRVAEWVARNGRSLKLRARVAAGSALWVEQNRDPAYLLPAGDALDEAQRLVSIGGGVLSEDERAYAQASSKRQHRRRTKRRVLLGAGALVVLLLLGGWLWYRDAYVVPRTEYYADIVKRYGWVEGRRALSLAQVQRRAVSVRVTRVGRRGKVQRIEAINGFGELTTSHDINSYIGAGQTSLLSAGRECRWDFVAGPDGNVASERAYSRTGRLVYEFVYSSLNTGYYKDANGYPLARTGSGAAYVTFTREPQGVNAGLDIEVRYTDASGRAQPNEDGSFGMKLAYDPRGWLERLTVIGADGQPMIGQDGFVQLVVERDRDGAITAMRYQDARGRPVRSRQGMAGLLIKNDDVGNRLETRYVDEQDQPVLVQGAAILRSVFDNHGGQVEERYFDEKDEPTLNSSLYHMVRMSYDAHGNAVTVDYFDESGHSVRNPQLIAGIRRRFNDQSFLLEERYIGEDQSPTLTAEGFAKARWAYDDRGNLIEEAWFDEQDHPVLRSDFAARWGYVYDDRNNNTELAAYDEHGQPTWCKDGYARRVDRFDARGNVIERTFYAPDGSLSMYHNSYARIAWTYDEHGNKIDERFFGLDLRPIRGADGYARQAMRYDERGQCVERIYYDTNGNPAWDKDGAARYTMRYDDRGNIVELMNRDQNGQPIRIRKGYAGIQWTFDVRGNRNSETLVDEQGRAAMGQNGYARTTWVSDELGHTTEKSTFDADGRPVADADGVARTTWRYDARGNEIASDYFDPQGQPTTHSDGNTGYRKRYNEQGKLIETSYVDRQGHLIAITSGYAMVRHTYDRWGNQQSTAFFGVDGEPVLIDGGISGYQTMYDSRRRQIETRFLGLDGKLARTEQNYSIVRYAYDHQGNRIEETHLDSDEKLVEDSEGLARVKRVYNERGMLAEETYFGADDKPTLSKGYAGIRRGYDDHGNQVSETYLGADGEPMLISSGFATWVAQYDQHGNQVRIEIHGLDGSRAHRRDGVSAITYRHDERGNQTEQAFFDTVDKPIAPADGAARTIWRYDDRDREIEVAYYDTDGKLIDGADGFSRRSTRYDHGGNIIELRYFGPDGNLSDAAMGYAVRAMKYDAQGRMLEDAYYVRDNVPCLNPRGFAGMVVEYDSSGDVLRRDYFDVDGKPVAMRAVIKRVEADQPGDKAGLRAGDIIERYDGKPVGGVIDFQRMVRDNTRAQVTMVVDRDGERQSITVSPGTLGIELQDEAAGLSRP